MARANTDTLLLEIRRMRRWLFPCVEFKLSPKGVAEAFWFKLEARVVWPPPQSIVSK